MEYLLSDNFIILAEEYLELLIVFILAITFASLLVCMVVWGIVFVLEMIDNLRSK